MKNKNPILFSSESTEFSTNGIGVLRDAISCTVTEELNGIYELDMEYPSYGRYFDNIKERCIILAKPNEKDEMQPFRIYRISSPMSGKVKIYAEHISYDLNGIQVSPFTASNNIEALLNIKSYSATENPFSFTTTSSLIDTAMNITTPRSARNCLYGEESICSLYDLEIKLDGYNVKAVTSIGEDTGMTIKYGSNLTDINQDINISTMYTGIYPFYYSSETGDYVELSDKILNADGDFGFTRIESVNLTSYFESKPFEVTLRKKAEEYILNNLNTSPVNSISIKFEQLKKYEEYKNMAFLEKVSMGDTIKVFFPKLNISCSQRVVKTVYDSIRYKYVSIVIGKVRSRLTNSIIKVKNSVNELVATGKGMIV